MKLTIVALAAMFATLAMPAAALPDTGIVATCNNAPCSTGWYRSDVKVSFILPAGSSNPQGCGDQSIAQDTAGQTFTCTVAVTGSQCCRLDVTVRRDATAPAVTAVTLTRGPDKNGWYSHAVDYSTAGSDAMSGIASCTAATYAGPDSGTASVTGTCTDAAGNVSAPKTLTFPYDATAPSVTPAPARGADANGWYNQPVAVAFAGSDAVSGLDSCTSGSYAGPDSGSASVSGSCTDKAGNTGTGSFGLRYDATAPSVTGETPDRPADAGDWYNHRVVVTFAGADATSGIASCDAPAYEKPDDPTASVTGRCTDNAGNASAPASFAFKYDSTPPKVSGFAVASLDRTAKLSWQASTDVSRITIARAAGGQATTLYDGKRVTSFDDKGVRNGNKYSYVVTAFDAAGNAVALKGVATPSAALLAPRGAARVQRNGVTLRWRPLKGAAYYNVQLWLSGRKILTTWPAGPSLRLPRLAPGKYTWLVWPGKGPRKLHRYGALIGSSTFIVNR